MYDIVIIGGGITGAGIARDAVLRGLKVALFEKGDFGGGTSSKSSKLIHGGLRYLEHGELGLVFESVSERAIQTKVAPHLVRPIPFVVPVYEQHRPGLELINIGLWIYDALALFRAPKRHRIYRGRKARAAVPHLSTDGLRGALKYYDCITDDSRLVLENILDAEALGASCHNYTQVETLEVSSSGTYKTVRVRNLLTGAVAQHRARAVVIAAGPWTDNLLASLGIRIGRSLLRLTKGVHLVFPHEQLPIKNAVTLISPVDGRVMFAIPWRHRTVIGTTDTDFDGNVEHVHATAEDAKYLCDSANVYFPTAQFRPQDVVATWAGLRPLIDQGNVEDESDISREHEMFVRKEGIVIIAGGKLTTYRRMSRQVVRATVEWLLENDDSFDKPLRRPRTKRRPLPGAAGLGHNEPDSIPELAAQLARDLDPEIANHLAWTYGVRARTVAQLMRKQSALAQRIEPRLPYTWAEIEFAYAHDRAKTVADVLGRRVPLLLVGADQGLDCTDRIAQVGQEQLQWSARETLDSANAYRAEVAATRRFLDG